MKAGSYSYLHSARSDIFLLKLQMMARAEGFEPSLAVLETVVLTVGRHPYMAEETGLEPAHAFT